MTQTSFEDWWFNGGQSIAEIKFSKQAEENIKDKLNAMPTFVPEENSYESNQLEVEANNLFWDELERLARIDYNIFLSSPQ